jgi:adenosylcobinamide-GDP ribazoletransferase
MRKIANSFLAAMQFLTRLPVHRLGNPPPEDLAGAAVFFPLAGLVVGGGAVFLNYALSSHVSRDVIVLLILIYLVLVTGGLHEDALGDAADGFGGGWDKNQILAIMRDSRIGSFGAIAITLSLLARFVLLTNAPKQELNALLLTSQVLSRWSALPLGFLLPSAREDSGQGVRLASKISAFSLAIGTILALIPVVTVFRTKAIWFILVAIFFTTVSGLYYKRKIGGVTGDCFGATTQITEVAIYMMGAVLA